MPDYTDKELAEFLEALNNGSDNVRLGEWEVKFLESQLQQIKKYGVDRVRFSEKMRAAIVKMMGKYNDKIK